MSHWFSLFGLGENFELGLPHKTGIVPSRDWKLSTLKQPWYKGESIVTSIGQGYLSATPLHLAYTAALVGSKGNTPKPTLIKGAPRIPPPNELQNIQAWELIHDAMDMVISYKNGTAHKRLAHLKLPIAGKTGTAQVVSHNKSEGSLNAAYKDHSLFMAFAPKENPSFAIVVTIEHEQYATEIAGKFLKEVFSKNLLPITEDKIEQRVDHL
jgi:penicillin-binding protein 2